LRGKLFLIDSSVTYEQALCGRYDRNREMKTLYDAESDALYLRFSDARAVESEEVSEGVVLDYDAEGRIVSIELLDASKHLAAGAQLPTAAE
jgi:uncharacterized protein YuzE